MGGLQVLGGSERSGNGGATADGSGTEGGPGAVSGAGIWDDQGKKLNGTETVRSGDPKAEHPGQRRGFSGFLAKNPC